MLYDVVDITEMSGRSDYKRINFKDLQVMISNAEYLLDRIEHLHDERYHEDHFRIVLVIVLVFHWSLPSLLPAMASIIFIYRPFISMPEDLNCGT